MKKNLVEQSCSLGSIWTTNNVNVYLINKDYKDFTAENDGYEKNM